MDYQIREKIVNRIISGYFYCDIGKHTFIVTSPSTHLKYQAQRLYDSVYYKNSFNGWLTRKNIVSFLVKQGLWDQNRDKKLKELEPRIDDLKVILFNNLMTDSVATKIRAELKHVRHSIGRLQKTRYTLDHMTLEAYVDRIKNRYLIASTLYYPDWRKVYDDPDYANFSLLNSVVDKINTNIIDVPVLRELARTEPWRSYYNIDKVNPFGKPIIEWSDNQKAIVLFSKMYDGAYQHPECPMDNVIEDDDAFDGWMISNKRKNEKDKMDSEVEKMVGRKQRDSSEIFIVTKDAKQASKIDKFNDVRGKTIKKQRDALIRKKGQVAESQLIDKKQELQQLATQQYIEKVKGKR